MVVAKHGGGNARRLETSSKSYLLMCQYRLWPISCNQNSYTCIGGLQAQGCPASNRARWPNPSNSMSALAYSGARHACHELAGSKAG